MADKIRGTRFEPEPLVRLFESALALHTSYEELAGAIMNSQRLVVTGTGPDLIAARELALKVNEGAWFPAATCELEEVLHGHLVAHDENSILLVLATPLDASTHLPRTQSLLKSARRIGMKTALIATAAVAAEINQELTSGGRIVVAEGVDLPPSLASLISSGIVLQRLTLTLAQRLGRNPDLLRRDVAAYRDMRSLVETKYSVET